METYQKENELNEVEAQLQKEKLYEAFDELEFEDLEDNVGNE